MGSGEGGIRKSAANTGSHIGCTGRYAIWRASGLVRDSDRVGGSAEDRSEAEQADNEAEYQCTVVTMVTIKIRPGVVTK